MRFIKTEFPVTHDDILGTSYATAHTATSVFARVFPAVDSPVTGWALYHLGLVGVVHPDHELHSGTGTEGIDSTLDEQILHRMPPRR